MISRRTFFLGSCAAVALVPVVPLSKPPMTATEVLERLAAVQLDLSAMFDLDQIIRDAENEIAKMTMRDAGGWF